MDHNSKPDNAPPPGYTHQNATPYGSTGPVQGYAYSPQPPQVTQHTVLLQQPQTVLIGGAALSFPEYPVVIVCPHCQATVTTATSYIDGAFTWVLAGVLCFFGLWLGCCLIPFCVDGAKDVEHRCPNCKYVVGKYSRIR